MVLPLAATWPFASASIVVFVARNQIKKFPSRQNENANNSSFKCHKVSRSLSAPFPSTSLFLWTLLGMLARCRCSIGIRDADVSQRRHNARANSLRSTYAHCLRIFYFSSTSCVCVCLSERTLFRISLSRLEIVNFIRVCDISLPFYFCIFPFGQRCIAHSAYVRASERATARVSSLSVGSRQSAHRPDRTNCAHSFVKYNSNERRHRE